MELFCPLVWISNLGDGVYGVVDEPTTWNPAP